MSLLAPRKKISVHCRHSINVIKLKGEFALIQALLIRHIIHEKMLVLNAFRAIYKVRITCVNDFEILIKLMSYKICMIYNFWCESDHCCCWTLAKILNSMLSSS